MLASLFYRNRRLTVLVLGLVFVAGISALQGLARQEDPTLSRRFGTITTAYPGASALRVESLVTEKVEQRILELHEIDEIRSKSRAGMSVIRVKLQDRYDEESVDEVWSKLRDRLADAESELPAGAASPVFEDRTSTAVTLLAALIWAGEGEAPIALMSRLAEELETRLRNVAGTEETELFGEAEEEIRIGVDPLALASANLTARDVSQAVVHADAKVPAGQLRTATNDLLLEVAGELDSIARIREVPIRREADGRFLRVGDIASVERAVREPPATMALIDGRPGVVVAATMETNRRVDRWAQEARAVVEAYRVEVPSDIDYELIFDQSVYTRTRLGTLVVNLLLGAAIVVAVLFFMMGARSALVVAAALPITVSAVLAQLNMLGIPLHQTSVTGLIIALGLLIDNAIVAVDEFGIRRRWGLDPEEAVVATFRHLFVPLMASTLTTVIAFLPIVLAPGPVSEFVGPISIGVGLSVTTSFLVSMTIILAFAAHFGVGADGARVARGPWWRAGFSNPRLTEAFRRSLRVTLTKPWVGVAVSLVLPVLGFALGQTLTEQFFPANDRNQFQVQLVLPSQTSIEETRANALRARELIHRHDEVVQSHWFLGEAAPRVFYNMFNNEDGVTSYAGAFVTTRSPEATEALLPLLQRELIDAFPNARVLALPFEQGPPVDAPIEARLVGPDLGVLRDLGDALRAILAETTGVTFTRAELAGGQPKLMLETDEDQARMVGLQLTDIADQLNARLEGAVGGSLIEANEEIPVRVRVHHADRQSLSQIAAGHVLPPMRGSEGADDAIPGVPLSVLSRPRLEPELAGVSRFDGERSNTVQGDLAPYVLSAEALSEFQHRIEEAGFAPPEGYRLDFGGESEERSQALGQLLAYALPLFVIMAGTIVLTFNSFQIASIVFAVGFLSVGLALLGVWTFGHPLGFVAIIGTMGLVGLAINDTIVVLTALRADERARDADVEGTAEVVIGATRHVLATTLTTIGGFLPLIVFGGRFWPPMATAIAGGVGGASILALYLVPSTFIAIRRRERRRAGAADRAAPAGVGLVRRPEATGGASP